MEQKVVDDSRLMKGHPGQMDTVNAPSNTGAAQPAASAAPQKKIFVGTKEFKSEEEVTNYALQLQQTVAEINLKKPVPALQNANQPKISQLLFEDPDAYTEATVQEAERRIESKFKARETEKFEIENFYKENPQLRGHEDLVQMRIAYRRNDYKDLPMREGLSKIAVEVSDLISKVKGSPTGGKELPSSPAIVAGSGNNGAAAQVVVKAEPRNFVDQLRQKQRKGKS